MDEQKKGPGDETASQGPNTREMELRQRGINDASGSAPQKPLFADAEALVKAGHQLIPLRHRDKAPRDKDWPRREYDNVKLIEWARAGYGNLGVRLRATDLVVDADPRNYREGHDSLAELARDTGLDLDALPHTITGGGGHHYWFRKPAEVETLSKLPQYPGIDFKSRGFQVVAPGSIHPSGGLYRSEFFLVQPDEAPEAPAALLGMLTVRRSQRPSGGGHDRWGELTPDMLAKTLEHLDPCNFREHDDWRDVMMAAHHATGGEGRQEFIDWSTSDPEYEGHAGLIANRWDSLHATAPGGRPTTVALLHKLVQAAGGHVAVTPPEDDFEEWEDPDAAGRGVDDSTLREPPKPQGVEAVIDEMNERHYVALDSGFKVVTEEPDPLFAGRVRYQRLSKSDFRSLYENQLVEKGDKLVTKADLWLKSPKRRTYNGLIFDPARNHPGWLNMWKGWSVEPKKADWSLLDSLIREVLTDGEGSSYDYVLNWIAFMFQHPERVAEVALAFRGAKGTGKGTLGRALFKLAGASGLHISSPGHLTGRFNSHLQNCVCLFADEAFWAGDKAGEAVLKQLVTEPTLTYEGKGRDAVTGKNHVHIVMASNNDWVVPAGMDGERRFAVFNVSERRRGDREFFRALNRQLDEGGLAGFLFSMLTRDLGDWHPRDSVPLTDALIEQKEMSMSAEESWYDEMLDSGMLPQPLRDEEPWHEREVEADKDELYRDYLAHAQGLRQRPRPKAGFAMRIKRRAGWRDRQVVQDDGRRVWKWVLPRLDDARAIWKRNFVG